MQYQKSIWLCLYVCIYFSIYRYVCVNIFYMYICVHLIYITIHPNLYEKQWQCIMLNRHVQLNRMKYFSFFLNVAPSFLLLNMKRRLLFPWRSANVFAEKWLMNRQCKTEAQCRLWQRQEIRYLDSFFPSLDTKQKKGQPRANIYIIYHL